GQAQRARIRATLSQPLKVKLLNELGDPVADKPVVFRVTEGDGQVGFGTTSQSQAVLEKTDANGVASVFSSTAWLWLVVPKPTWPSPSVTRNTTGLSATGSPSSLSSFTFSGWLNVALIRARWACP